MKNKERFHCFPDSLFPNFNPLTGIEARKAGILCNSSFKKTVFNVYVRLRVSVANHSFLASAIRTRN